MSLKMLERFVIGLLLADWASGNPTKTEKQCRDYVLPVTITSSNFVWALPPLQDDFDITSFTTDLTRWDSSQTFAPITTPAEVTADYKIGGTFCTPRTGGSGTVLLASHGLGFDRSYWDPEFEPEKYSFVDYAVERGYSVFFYDRLGVSKSSVVSGYVSQVSNQVAILEQLVKQLKAGKFGMKPKSVVLLGHSFGSVISNVLLTSNPDIVDAAVLTGIGYETPSSAETFLAWQPRLARLQSPGRWRQLDGGYITWVDIFSNINTFFKVPFYDIKVAKAADDNKQPFSLMEVITLTISNLTAPAFTGPVMVLSGEYDYIFCTGFCGGILTPGAEKAFSASKDLQVYMQPNSGHGINLSLNATGAFEVITTFLAKHGF
ncbi:Alpha/Beta hydrolase protein [Xylogone sp. PMI_703]|nr:Alpha/Beta hydrolase protein [Xylogone sp. PMI_703]